MNPFISRTRNDRPRHRGRFTVTATTIALAVIGGFWMPAAMAQELGGDKPPRDRARDDKPQSPEREELRRRFEQRMPALNKLKDQGLIGETWDGYVEALHNGLLAKDNASLVEDENKDRKQLYSLIANRVDDEDKERKDVPPRIVAERNAKRKFENAQPNHYLKIKEGRWIQKRDEARAEKITRLKNDGSVGETWEGTLEAINTKPSDDVRSLVEQENRDRLKMYSDIASRLEGVKREEVARAAAKVMYEHLPPGQSFKTREGAWERRPSRDQ